MFPSKGTKLFLMDLISWQEEEHKESNGQMILELMGVLASRMSVGILPAQIEQGDSRENGFVLEIQKRMRMRLRRGWTIWSLTRHDGETARGLSAWRVLGRCLRNRRAKESSQSSWRPMVWRLS